MINRGSVRNYQRSEDHCPVKPWLGLPVVSLFAPETINEIACLSHCKQTGLTLASNGRVTNTKLNRKVGQAEAAATEPEDE